MTYSTEIQSLNPDVYYQFDETTGTSISDSSGNGHTGTYVGSPDLNVPGLVVNDSNTAVNLSASKYISTSYRLPNNNFTATCLWKVKSLGTTNPDYITPIIGTQMSNNGFVLYVNNNNTGSHPKITFLNRGSAVVETPILINDTNIEFERTYHIALAVSTNNIKLYVDGTLIYESSYTGIIDNTGALNLGKEPSNNSYYANGDTVDEFAAFNYVLSPTQIDNLYKTSLDYTTDDYGDYINSLPVSAYWKMDEMSGSILDNYSNTHGTVTGTVDYRLKGFVNDTPSKSIHFNTGSYSAHTSATVASNIKALSMQFKTPTLTPYASGLFATGDIDTNKIGLYKDSSHRLRFFKTTAGATTDNIITTLESTKTYNVLVAFKNNDTVYYVNGVEITRDNSINIFNINTDAMYINTFHLDIGDIHRAGEYTIDNVVLFNQELDTPSKIAADLYRIANKYTLPSYSAGSYPDIVSKLNPTSYYRMGDLSGTIAKDEQGIADADYIGTPHFNGDSLITNDVNPSTEFQDDAYAQVTDPRVIKSLVVNMKVNSSNDTYEGIFNQGDTNANRALLSYWGDVGNLVWFESSVTKLTAPIVVDTNYHIVITSGPTSYMYINGIEVDSYVGELFQTPEVGYQIGTYFDNGSYTTRRFDGLIDEVSIYDYALTGNNIRDLYRASIDFSLPTYPINSYEAYIDSLTPLLFYRMDETSGTVMNDEYGMFHGEYINAPELGVDGLTVTSNNAVHFTKNKYSVIDYVLPIKSISFMINMDTITSAHALFGMGSSNAVRLFIRFVSNTISLYNGGTKLSYSVSGIIKHDQTFNLVITSGPTSYMYINGIEVDSYAGEVFTLSDSPSHIGTYYSSGLTNRDVYCVIDEVTIFDYQLTQANIENLYLKSINYTPLQIIDETYNSVVMEDSPIAYWDLQETFGSAGANYVDPLKTLAFIGNPLINQPGYVSGNTKSINTGDTNQLKTNAYDVAFFNIEGSIEFWVKFNATTQYAYLFVVGKDDTSQKMGLQVYAGKYRLIINSHSYATTNPINIGAWNHIMITRTIDKYFRLYINGSISLEEYDASGMSSYQDYIYLGDSNIAAQFNDMNFSNFSVYDKSLSQEQVKRHYYYGRAYHSNDYDESIIYNTPDNYYLQNNSELNNDSFNPVNIITTPSIINNTQGKSYQFNGVNSYIEIASYNKDVMSLELWFKPSNIVNNGNYHAIATTNLPGVSTWLGVKGNKPNIYISNDNLSSITLVTNQLYHLVLTRNNGTWELFINGALDISGGNSTIFSVDSFGTDIHTGTATQLFEGEMSNISLYDYVLDATEILKNYNIGIAGTYSLTETYDYDNSIINDSPLVYYKMNEITGAATIIDQVNSYNGVATNITTESGAIQTDKANTSLSFNGASNIFLPNDLIFNDATFAIEFWFKSNETATQTLVNKRQLDESDGWVIDIRDYNKVRCRVKGVNGTEYNVESAYLRNQWVYVMVQIKNDVLEMYINGRLTQTTDVVTGIKLSQATPITIGSTLNSAYLTGNIDEFAYYNNPLTTYQIEKHYLSSFYHAGKFSTYHRISGISSVDGTPQSCHMRAYRRDTGEFVQEVLSDASGNYTFSDLVDTEYDIICFIADDTFRPEIQGKLSPLIVIE